MSCGITNTNEVKLPYEIVTGHLKDRFVHGFYPLLYMIISMMNARLTSGGDMTNLTYSICAYDFKSIYGFKNGKSIYKKMHDLSAHLNKCGASEITYVLGKILKSDPDEVKEYRVFNSINYQTGEGAIIVSLTPQFNKIVLDGLMRTGYHVYFDLQEVLRMKSQYSMAIFPFLIKFTIETMSFKAEGSLKGQSFTTIISIDSLREKLNLPKSYTVSDIRNLCDKVVSDVNAYTRYKLSVESNYAHSKDFSKKITHICFLAKEGSTETDDSTKTSDTTKINSAAVTNDSTETNTSAVASASAITNNSAEVDNSTETDASIVKIFPDSIEQTEKPSKYDIMWLEGLTNGVITGRTAEKVMLQAKKYGRSREYVEKCLKASNKETTNNVVGMMISLIQNGLDEPIRGGSSEEHESVDDYLLRVMRTGNL